METRARARNDSVRNNVVAVFNKAQQPKHRFTKCITSEVVSQECTWSDMPNVAHVNTKYFRYPSSGGAYHDEEARLEFELKKVTWDGETVWVGMCCVCKKFVIVKGHEDYEGLIED